MWQKLRSHDARFLVDCDPQAVSDDATIVVVMDIETAEAVDALRSDINRVEHKIDRVDARLTGEIVRVETSLAARIDRVERRVEQVETSLTAKMIELNDDAKRHTSVQFESLQHNQQIMAEALATLTVEVKSLRR